MRTTLDLDSDVIQAAKSIAKLNKATLGKVISQLSRKGLEGDGLERVRNGVPLFPSRANNTKVTMEMVNQLRDSY